MELRFNYHIANYTKSYGRSFLGCFIILIFGFVANGSPSPFGDFYDKRGNKIGTDSINDGKKYIVTARADIRKIKRLSKMETITRERDVPSSIILPSDAALRESLDVLKRTEANGGLKEQSSIVMKDDSVIRGAVGEQARLVNGLHTAECTLPALPKGKTKEDVETTIHPHPTSVQYVSGQVYPHTAISPSRVDRSAFTYFTTNIIVGPLEEIYSIGRDWRYGTLRMPDRRMGIAVYYHNGAKPSVKITRKAAEKILKK